MVRCELLEKMSPFLTMYPLQHKEREKTSKLQWNTVSQITKKASLVM